jgi:DNA replication and repair protein RecF
LGQLHHQISASLSPRVHLKLDGKKARAQQLVDLLPVVLFSPESLSAIKDAPEQRRLLVDDLLWTKSPECVECMKDFNKVLRHRNRLLRDQKRRALPLSTFERTLEGLNDLYLPLATRLTYERLQVLRAVQPQINTAFSRISRGTSVDISVDYLVSRENAVHWSYQEIFDALHTRMNELASSERETGSTLVGPHKHDIQVLFGGENSRFYCSQGQQRALILAFKMAQIMYHYEVHKKHPILLLDDVLSELDSEKQEYFMQFLNGIQTQVFLTSTDLPALTNAANCNIKVFDIANGKIQKG